MMAIYYAIKDYLQIHLMILPLEKIRRIKKLDIKKNKHKFDVNTNILKNRKTSKKSSSKLN
jgi:diadenosine tetraphosphate (Ap4A) HIT family hydrolase